MVTEWAESLGGIADRRLVWLAAMVSLPPLAPFPLVRQVRRAGLGRGTLHLEAELCETPMVTAVAADGIELHPDFRAQARRVLRDRVLEGGLDAEELRQVTRIDAMGLSPLLELEENLVWAYVSQPNPGQTADRLLTDCLLSVVRETRHRILDWAAGALGRLPQPILRTPAAWLLSELCVATRRPAVRLPAPDLDQVDGDLLGEVARLLPTALVGMARDGDVLSFGPIARNRRVAFPVPAIVHKPVTVSWSGPDGPQQTTVDLGGHGVVRLPVGRGEVRLRTVAGRVFTLRPIPPGEPAPEIADLDAKLDVIDEAWRASRTIRAHVTRMISTRTAIVALEGAEGLGALLRSEPADEREGRATGISLGMTLGVRISNFDRVRQRVVCRPAPPEPWTGGDLAVGAELEGRYESSVNFGIFVSLPTSPRGWAGPVVSGLVHTSEFPPSWRWVPPDLAPGDPVRVRILSIDPARRRVALTALDDRPDPLLVHPVGDVVTGTLVKIVPFGVFVRLPSGVEALLHRSEIAAGTRLELGLAMRVRIQAVHEDLGRVNLVTEPRLPQGAPAIEVMPPTQPSGKSTPRQRARAVPPPPSRPGQLDPAEVAEFLRAKLREPGVVHAATLAQQVIERFEPRLHGDRGKWLGMGSFTLMLRSLVPGVRLFGNRVLPPPE
ncbi:S1 RNA-binding domain-containing protein [Actinokineospora sp. UTMC 2448]|uniref:S1 RNA-binding domain-containing protein n=1 Tax=Actinokineospora sp. UTMC 2448 TaxID=2268449 RepID=UPI002164DEF3|nr:S1 RNA-binding domain-containing protein [Actinokineospora sp. UTMC 2448]UVS78553.1 30S ribosomal protein S1 [Actinokineospora sp. UTMC 2448]